MKLGLGRMHLQVPGGFSLPQEPREPAGVHFSEPKAKGKKWNGKDVWTTWWIGYDQTLKVEHPISITKTAAKAAMLLPGIAWRTRYQPQNPEQQHQQQWGCKD